jgi:hypothetical protein
LTVPSTEKELAAAEFLMAVETICAASLEVKPLAAAMEGAPMDIAVSNRALETVNQPSRKRWVAIP